MVQKYKFRWVVPALWMLGGITILSAFYRFFITGNALVSGVAPADPADMPYVIHPVIAALHLVSGTIFLMLGPLQFISGIRTRWPVVHRWVGRLFVVSGLITAVSAIILNLVFPPVGGVFKSMAVYVFSVALFVSLLIALRAILRREIMRHRAWMIRSFAIGLSVSTMRVFFIPVYFLYGLPNDFTIGLGMWVGFVINIVVAEIILLRERRSKGMALSV